MVGPALIYSAVVVPFMPRAARDAGLFVESPPGAADTLAAFERAWKNPVQVVLFFFGLVNAGVPMNHVGPGTAAVLIGVLAGKPLGILAAVALALGVGLHLPRGLAWRDLIVVGFAAGIGFTVALFFATAAFPPGPLLEQTKMGALLSVSGSIAAFVAAAALGVGRYRAAG
jgi:NhaA family Na+:H+ antiporter